MRQINYTFRITLFNLALFLTIFVKYTLFHCIVFKVIAEIIFLNRKVMSVTIQINEVSTLCNVDRFMRKNVFVFNNDRSIIYFVKTKRIVIVNTRLTLEMHIIMISKNKEQATTIALHTLNHFFQFIYLVFIQIFIVTTSSTEKTVPQIPNIAVVRKIIKHFQNIFVHAIYFRNVCRISIRTFNMIRTSAIFDNIGMTQMKV